MFQIAKVLALAILCFVQGHNSETVGEATSELARKVSIAQIQIELVIRDGGRQIGLTRAAIGKNVGIAERNVGDQLSQLGSVIEQAKAEAKENSEDITACVDATNAALSKLGLNGLSTCRSSFELDLLGLKLGQLGQLKAVLGSSIDKCLLANPKNVEGLRQCVDGDLNKVQEQTDQTKAEINETAQNSQKNSEACVATTTDKLTQQISEVASDLKTCLKRVL